MDRQKYLEDTGGIVRMHMEELLNENERLRKERKWLLDHMVYEKEDRQWIEDRMQQALKE